MGSREFSLAVADVRVVDPHIFINIKEGSVQIVRSQVCVVLGIVDDEEIPVVLQHPIQFSFAQLTHQEIYSSNFLGVRNYRCISPPRYSRDLHTRNRPTFPEVFSEDQECLHEKRCQGRRRCLLCSRAIMVLTNFRLKIA